MAKKITVSTSVLDNPAAAPSAKPSAKRVTVKYLTPYVH